MTSKMIALIGEQPIPNLLPIKHDKPAEVLLVQTSRTKPVSERLRKIIRNSVSVHTCDVANPYDIPAIYHKLADEIEKLQWSPDEIIFNLTGGTKTMAFAAYQLASDRNNEFLYLESEQGRSRLRQYRFENKSATLKRDEIIPDVITIPDYLNAHLPGFSEDGFSKDQRGQINSGGRFEERIYHTLKSQVDEIMVGVRPNGVEKQIEIDLVVRCGNQVGIIEAKTGVRKEGIDQLSTAGGRAYLGTYTAKFLITGGRLRSDYKALAAAREIKVVELPGYVEGKHLPQKEESRLIQAIREKLKC